MHDPSRVHDPKTRCPSRLPLLAALALLPLAAAAEPPPAPVPDECCELAALGGSHARHRAERRTPAPAVTADDDKNAAAPDELPDLSSPPAMALLLVSLGGFIARSRRSR